MSIAIESRIERIINNIYPITHLNNQFDYPKTLADRLNHYHTPGISIAVINNFHLEWAEGFGVCNSQSQQTVTPNTLFQAASISKSIFALAIMRLVQNGQLNLDEDIHHYLSSWHLPAHKEWQQKITLRQLLSHTAGLGTSGFPGYQREEKLPTLIHILNGEYPANTAKVESIAASGLHFSYSGGGTLVAQQLIEDVLKTSFPDIMHTLIFQPLEMSSSTYEQPLPDTWINHVATAHPENGVPLKGQFHIYPEMAAAGLWTTPTDLAKVGIELLDVLNNRKTSSFLTKKSVEEMLLPQNLHGQIVNQTGGIGLGDDCKVGLGFFSNGKDQDFYFGHNGWNEGFLSQMRFYKELGKGAIIMLNSNEGYPLLHEVMNAIGREYEWPESHQKETMPSYLSDYQKYTSTYLSKG